MKPTIRNARLIRKEIQKSAIRTLENAGYSRDEIGKRCGYPDRQTVDKVMQNGVETVMNGDASLILSVWASEEGSDEMANTYSAHGKINLPFQWEIDGDLTNEITEIVSGAGVGREAFEDGVGHQALKESERLVRAAVGYRTEVYHRFGNVRSDTPCFPQLNGHR